MQQVYIARCGWHHKGPCSIKLEQEKIVPTPMIGISRSKSVACDVHLSRFYVAFGHKDRASIQIDLDPSGDVVYISYYDGDKMKMSARDVPWDTFAEAIKVMSGWE